MIEDLRSGTRLPAPDDWKPEAPGMTCRLVRYRGRHIPFDAWRVDDPEDPWHLESQEEAVNAAEQLLSELGLKLRSRWKGVAMGEEVLEMTMNQESASDRRSSSASSR